jgi:hypothetical protein
VDVTETIYVRRKSLEEELILAVEASLLIGDRELRFRLLEPRQPRKDRSPTPKATALAPTPDLHYEWNRTRGEA